MAEPQKSVENEKELPTTTHQGIDVENLAEKVYQLMRADIRLARARGNERGKRK